MLTWLSSWRTSMILVSLFDLIKSEAQCWMRLGDSHRKNHCIHTQISVLRLPPNQSSSVLPQEILPAPHNLKEFNTRKKSGLNCYIRIFILHLCRMFDISIQRTFLLIYFIVTDLFGYRSS